MKRLRYMLQNFSLQCLILFLLAACQRFPLEAGALPHVWIDAPLSGAQIPLNTNLLVTAYASSQSTVTQMSLFINGAPVAGLTVSSVEEGLYQGVGNWIPPTPGSYSLSVQAVAADGSSAMSDAVLLIVGEVTPELVTPNAPTPVVELTADSTSIDAGSCTTLHWRVQNVQPQSIDLNGEVIPLEGSKQVCLCQTMSYVLVVLTTDDNKYGQSVTINVNGECVTPTTPPPISSVDFWADATNLKAGSCTTLHWQTVNVLGVYFDGRQVNASGQHQTCPCVNETHYLDVVLADGSKDQRTLTIGVSGSCVVPTTPPPQIPPPPPPPTTQAPPPQDTTPPPAPNSLKPGSTDPGKPQDLGSCSPVILRWEPVSDPSGIQGYRVGLQQNNNGQWVGIEPSFIIYDTNVDVTQWLSAGWDYRWNVWAIDNAGNHGALSIWRYFACPLY